MQVDSPTKSATKASAAHDQAALFKFRLSASKARRESPRSPSCDKTCIEPSSIRPLPGPYGPWLGAAPWLGRSLGESTPASICVPGLATRTRTRSIRVPRGGPSRSFRPQPLRQSSHRVRPPAPGARGGGEPSFFCFRPVDGELEGPGPGVPPGRLRARPPVVSWRDNYAATFPRLRGAVAPPLAPLAAPGIRR